MGNNRLPFLDTTNFIAILCIVIFHGMGAFDTGIPPLFNQFLSYFGLVLFTLTSAYKFYYREMGNGTKPTYSRFIKKRAVRLLKPYYGYSLLALPMLLGFYSVLSYLGDPTLLNRLLDTMHTPQVYLAFVFGDDFIAVQLWYLMALFFINAIVGFVFIKYREKGLLVLFPVLAVLAFMFEGHGNPLSSHIPMNINILLNTIQFSLIFIIGIAIAQVFSDQQNKSIYWLLPASIVLLFIGYWLFIVPILFFLVICFARNYPLLNREYKLTRYSFQIYLFHLPIFLFLASIILIVRYHMNNLFGLTVAIGLTILLCILAYGATKRLRLNMLFE